jgi:hypothetical protein
MARTTVLFGVALVVLGVVGYFGTGQVSLTALIPAAFGVVLVVLGALATDESRRKHAMHAAALIGVLGLLGSLRGLPGVVRLLTGGAVERPSAVIAQGLMAVLMAAFVAMCVSSFRAARRARAAR